MYRNILVPIDGSAMASRGLHEAVQLSKQLGSRIRVIHVLNETPWTDPSFLPATIGDLATELRRAGESILERGRQEVASAGVEADLRLVGVAGESGNSSSRRRTLGRRTSSCVVPTAGVACAGCSWEAMPNTSSA